jgi:hypothetical protein
MASGQMNRTKGRTRGCSDQHCGVKILLANPEPSTQDPMRTSGPTSTEADRHVISRSPPGHAPAPSRAMLSTNQEETHACCPSCECAS